MIPAWSRTRAAFCHLSVLTVFGAFLFPLATNLIEEPDPEFNRGHRVGAIIYQLVGLLVLFCCYVLSGLFGNFADDFTAGAALTFFWIVFLCAAGVYFLGAVYLAMQAWSGSPFELGLLNSMVYKDR